MRNPPTRPLQSRPLQGEPSPQGNLPRRASPAKHPSAKQSPLRSRPPQGVPSRKANHLQGRPLPQSPPFRKANPARRSPCKTRGEVASRSSWELIVSRLRGMLENHVFGKSELPTRENPNLSHGKIRTLERAFMSRPLRLSPKWTSRSTRFSGSRRGCGSLCG